MINRKKFIIVGSFVLIVSFCLGYYLIREKETSSNLTTNNIDSDVNTDDGDQDIVWSNYENREIVLTSSINITEAGVYNLSGTIKDGLITVDTDSNVKLNFNDVSITNSDGPAIYVKNALDVVINISGENYLEDGGDYSTYTEVDGVVFSHDDLTLEGNGSLEIKANYMDGLVSKDDLKIVSGNYIINSNDDAIRGKDSVYILDGNFNINALGDGIKSTNDTDSEKGFIKILGGNFKIEATLDGVQSENKLIIENGEFDVTTGGGSGNSSSASNSWGSWGRGSMQSSSTESAKGFKAVDNLVIKSGTYNFNTSDDSIHSNNYVGISGGGINISSGDDGIHADYELIIDDGAIKIEKSYEGIESAKITINGGDIDLVALDDGINIAGGNDASATNRPGENSYTNSDNILTINAGVIYIDATGDGIDVNGSAYINGGSIRVDGPTNSGNGALDYDRVFAVNGGTLIAAGESGMAQSVTNESSQYNVIIYFSNSYSNGDTVTIVDDNNNEIMTYSSNKSYSSLVFSASELISNTKYTIKVNDEIYETFTTTSKSMTVGNHKGGMMGPTMGGRR